MTVAMLAAALASSASVAISNSMRIVFNAGYSRPSYQMEDAEEEEHGERAERRTRNDLQYRVRA